MNTFYTDIAFVAEYCGMVSKRDVFCSIWSSFYDNDNRSIFKFVVTIEGAIAFWFKYEDE